jgi:hypothetical protein
VFNHTDRLQETYGLRPATTSLPGRPEDEGPTTQSQLILGSVFKRAYETLRKSAKERQRGTPITKKTLWAVHDKKKFQDMIAEIKGFNDNLHSLFPDVQSRTNENLRNEIDQSEDINALQSLQEATTDDHEDISETASIRLEALGATSTARSRISEDAATITEEINASLASQGLDDEAAADAGAESVDSEELDELSKQMKAVDEFVSKKTVGALTLSLMGPQSYSARVSAHVYWDGKDSSSYFDDGEKGFVKSSHSSFGSSYQMLAACKRGALTPL